MQNPQVNEPTYLIQWAVPWFKGFVSDTRPGAIFIFSIIIGESKINDVRDAVERDPGIVRKTGEYVFPELFSDLRNGLDYAGLLHYLMEQPHPDTKLREI